MIGFVALLASAVAAAPGAAAVERPPVHWDPIPFPARRGQEMRRYAKRHYGVDDFRLRDPRVIVEHITVTSTYRSTWNTFATDVPDPELKELPGTCVHFVIDARGGIHQLVPLGRMCRHTVGLNHRAIGIEHVAMRDGDLMGDERQLQASLRLTRWLQGRYAIETRDVIGHSESLGSRWHREKVARLQHQTHGDMTRATMTRYRGLLR